MNSDELLKQRNATTDDTERHALEEKLIQALITELQTVTDNDKRDLLLLLIAQGIREGTLTPERREWLLQRLAEYIMPAQQIDVTLAKEMDEKNRLDYWTDGLDKANRKHACHLLGIPAGAKSWSPVIQSRGFLTAAQVVVEHGINPMMETAGAVEIKGKEPATVQSYCKRYWPHLQAMQKQFDSFDMFRDFLRDYILAPPTP